MGVGWASLSRDENFPKGTISKHGYGQAYIRIRNLHRRCLSGFLDLRSGASVMIFVPTAGVKTIWIGSLNSLPYIHICMLSF
jgi:hypothetical protein